MAEFVEYKHQIKRLVPDPSGDAGLVINDNFEVIADFLDGVTLLGHAHSGSDITSGTIADARLSPTAQNAISATHSPLTLGTASGLSLVGQALSLALATTGAAGAMSAADKTKLDGIDLSQYLALSGGTMSGHLDMNGSNIDQVATLYATEVQATTINLNGSDLGTELAKYLPIDGSLSMEADLDLNGNTLVNGNVDVSDVATSTLTVNDTLTVSNIGNNGNGPTSFSDGIDLGGSNVEMHDGFIQDSNNGSVKISGGMQIYDGDLIMSSGSSLVVSGGDIVDCAGLVFNSGSAIDLAEGEIVNCGTLTVLYELFATGLPTSDPAVAGQLWNDGGTVKVSAG